MMATEEKLEPKLMPSTMGGAAPGRPFGVAMMLTRAAACLLGCFTTDIVLFVHPKDAQHLSALKICVQAISPRRPLNSAPLIPSIEGPTERTIVSEDGTQTVDVKVVEPAAPLEASRRDLEPEARLVQALDRLVAYSHRELYRLGRYTDAQIADAATSGALNFSRLEA